MSSGLAIRVGEETATFPGVGVLRAERVRPDGVDAFAEVHGLRQPSGLPVVPGEGRRRAQGAGVRYAVRLGSCAELSFKVMATCLGLALVLIVRDDSLASGQGPRMCASLYTFAMVEDTFEVGRCFAGTTIRDVCAGELIASPERIRMIGSEHAFAAR